MAGDYRGEQTTFDRSWKNMDLSFYSSCRQQIEFRAGSVFRTFHIIALLIIVFRIYFKCVYTAFVPYIYMYRYIIHTLYSITLDNFFLNSFSVNFV